jgi:hypothetical protein
LDARPEAPTLASRLRALSDAQLLAVVGLVLFVLSAWPLLLVRIPPLQDLPNHLATAVVLDHPAEYPEYVANGYLKTNATLFLWLHLLGPRVGLALAAKLFVALVLAVGALAYPGTILALRGRERLLSSSLLVWPMLHNWFVCMGMLDYALGVPLALLVLVALERHRAAPSVGRGALAAAIAILVWYTHAFALLVAGLLVLVEQVLALTRDGKKGVAVALRLGVPLLPAAALLGHSILLQVGGAKIGEPEWGFRPGWELFYDAWAEWLWGFSKSTLSSFVVAIVLGVIAVRAFRERVPFFSAWALAIVTLLFFVAPNRANNWFCINSRFLPFLWMAALVRVPERLPRWLERVLLASAVAYSVGMGVDYVRIARTWDRFAAGIPAVPEHAKMLPLVFDRKGPAGENTAPMLHAWGLYVLEKHTSSPLVFAHSQSFPITSREEPPLRFHQLYLEPFPQRMNAPSQLCAVVRGWGVVPDDCEAFYAEAWREFWKDAVPRFDHVLMWGPSKATMAHLPKEYRVAFAEDELVILERNPTVAPSP